MEKEFVPAHLAIKMKILGFNEPCLVGVKNNETLTGTGFTFTNFNNNVHDFVLPLWQQAFDYFRNEHNFIVSPIKYYKYYFAIEKINKGICETEFIDDTYPLDTYEQARLACLEKLIELVTNK